MSKKSIFLNISDIASFIGQNIYDFITPFERLWKRCDTEFYNSIINKNKQQLLDMQLALHKLEGLSNSIKDDLDSKRITKRQYTLRINRLEKESLKIKNEYSNLETIIDNIDLDQKQRLTKQIGRENIDLVQSNSLETQDKRDNIAAIIKQLDISDDKKNILFKESESFINKNHGTLKEDSAIQMYERRSNLKLDTSQQFFKKQLNREDSSINWFIGGKVDGLYIDKENPKLSHIVEVKNRTRGFFTSLRDYEKTQIHMYMYILSIPVAKLVEKYENQIRITVIYQDNDYLNNILSDLNVFINRFNDFLQDSNLKTKYVSSNLDEKKILIRRLYLNEINEISNTRLISNSNDVISNSSENNCLINDDL